MNTQKKKKKEKKRKKAQSSSRPLLGLFYSGSWRRRLRKQSPCVIIELVVFFIAWRWIDTSVITHVSILPLLDNLQPLS